MPLADSPGGTQGRRSAWTEEPPASAAGRDHRRGGTQWGGGFPRAVGGPGNPVGRAARKIPCCVCPPGGVVPRLDAAVDRPPFCRAALRGRRRSRRTAEAGRPVGGVTGRPRGFPV